MTVANLKSSTNKNPSRSKRRARQETAWFYFFISPWIIGFFIFTMIPMLFSLATAFTNYDGFNLFSGLKWVGLRNFQRIFTDDNAYWGIKQSLKYTLITIPTTTILAFSYAVLLNQKIRGRGVFGALFYIPTVMPIVATSWIWKMMLTKNSGVVNAVIGIFWPGKAINWLNTYAFQTLILLSLWQIGSGIIIYLAALQNVPQSLEEAAVIDGASQWKLLRYVTIPLITPVIFMQLIFGLIAGFSVLTLPILLSETGSGGSGLGVLPPRPIQMYMIHAMQQLMVTGRYGYSSALLWLFAAFILIITLIVWRTQRYWVYYEVAPEGE